MKKTIILSLLSFTTLAGHADEGMWMLTDLKEQNAATMYDMGLDIGIDKVCCPDSISLKDAVVHFGGGCTGEVISAEGLVLTNHHCGYGYIQQHSSVEHDYLTDGFWAMTRKEELPCEGLTVTFIDKILDITPYVKEQLAKDKDPEGLNYLSPSYLGKVAERFAKQENIEVTPFTALELKPFYGANRYYLFVKTIYKDAADTITGNCDCTLFLGGKEKSTLKEISEVLGKETIDLYNTSETRSNNNSYGLNYQKTGKELMSQDEIAVMDGAKCILQLRGVRPFLSNKYDITKHPKYRQLSDYDKRNAFDIEKYRQHKLVVKPDDTFDLYDMGEVDAD